MAEQTPDYAALAAECEARAKAGEGPAEKWELIAHDVLRWTFGLVRNMPHGYIDFTYNGKSGWYFEPHHRMNSFPFPMENATAAQLFAESVIKHKTAALWEPEIAALRAENERLRKDRVEYAAKEFERYAELSEKSGWDFMAERCRMWAKELRLEAYRAALGKEGGNADRD